MSSMLNEIVRVVSSEDIPKHATPCPYPERGQDMCPLDVVPTYNNEEYPFKKGEVKILPVNVARHFQQSYKGKIKIEGSPVNVQDVLTMAVKNPSNLQAFISAGVSGRDVEIKVSSGVMVDPGENQEEAIIEATSTLEPGGRVGIVKV